MNKLWLIYNPLDYEETSYDGMVSGDIDPREHVPEFRVAFRLESYTGEINSEASLDALEAMYPDLVERRNDGSRYTIQTTEAFMRWLVQHKGYERIHYEETTPFY